MPAPGDKSFEKHPGSGPMLTAIESEIAPNNLFSAAYRLKPCSSILNVRYVKLMANYLTFQIS